MKKVPFVFFGTSDFAVHVLDMLVKSDLLPVLIITETDKQKGRGLKLSPPPVKVWALSHNIPTLQPPVLDHDSCYTLHPTRYTFFLVAAYGKILPKKILDIPKNGTVNIHPSLLPKYRGPSPIQSAIMVDDRNMGVSIMLLDEKMDHGPIIASRAVSFEPWPPDTETASNILARAGGELIAEILPAWLSGDLKPTPQDHSKATYTKKLTKSDGLLDLSADAYLNWRKIRAYGASPGAYFLITHSNKQIRVKVTGAEFKDGALLITRVIPENKSEMSYADFRRGFS